MRSTFQTIKRVSGRLSRFFHLRAKEARPVHRLLIIDDEQAICFSMAEFFSHQGFQVDVAFDYEQAERLISEITYGVIIQDLSLGNQHDTVGFEIIRFVRQHSKDTKIIVLTAHPAADFEEKAKQAGADAFLPKPQRLTQVANVVRRFIELSSEPGH